jgi:mannosyl-oligosaccharide alpha-1,2-mannosidase
VAGIINNLLYVSPQRRLLYVTELKNNFVTHVFEHLSCFLPGLLALGEHSLGPHELSADERRLHKWAAEGLANTCWLTYLDSRTGLGPDEVFFSASAPGGESAMKWVDALRAWGGGDGIPPGLEDGVRQERNEDRDYRDKNSKYILRPEVCM